MIIKALNNTTKLNSFILTFLVFKTYLKVNQNLFFLFNIIKKTKAIKKVIKILYKKKKKVKINIIINYNNKQFLYNI